jgi:hypothetical protein
MLLATAGAGNAVRVGGPDPARHAVAALWEPSIPHLVRLDCTQGVVPPSRHA